jgi:DNA-binding MltR family transcriptional regulator
MDDILLDLHKASLRTNAPAMKDKEEEKWQNQLLKWPGPISSFATRIKIAFGYGLITKVDFRNLEILRELRNAAAHPKEPFEQFMFRTKKITDQIRKFTIISLPGYREGDFKALKDFEHELKEGVEERTFPDPMKDPIRLYLALVIDNIAASLLPRAIYFSRKLSEARQKEVEKMITEKSLLQREIDKRE